MDGYFRSSRTYALARWSSVLLAVLFVLGECGALVGARYDLGDGWFAKSVPVVVWSALVCLVVLAASYPVRTIWMRPAQSDQAYRLAHLRALKDRGGAGGPAQDSGLADPVS